MRIICADCQQDRRSHARGLCSRCYEIRRAHGTLDERPRSPRGIKADDDPIELTGGQWVQDGWIQRWEAA